MRPTSMRRHASLTVSTLLALIILGVVAMVGGESVSPDPFDDHEATAAIVQELALRSLPSPRALPRDRVEGVSAESPSRSHRPILQFSASRGVPAETGKALLTYSKLAEPRSHLTPDSINR